MLIKRIALILILIFFVTYLSGCGDKKVINNVKYDTYGLYNENEKRNPDIEYKIIIGNIVWSIILIETIIAPVYFILFDMYEPIGPKLKIKGQTY